MAEQTQGLLTEDERSMLMKYYGAFFLGFIMLAIPAAIAVYFIKKRQKEEELSLPVLNHLNFMIRTFWITLVVLVVAYFMSGYNFIGLLFFVVCYAIVAWGLFRFVRGLIFAFDGQGIANPETFAFPERMPKA